MERVRDACRLDTAIRLSVLAIFCTAVTASRVHAGCNVIPDPAPVYRGVRGSIDRPYLIPNAEPFILRPACGSPRFIDLALDANGDRVVTPVDLLVTVVPSARNAEREAFLIAGNDDCGGFEEPVSWMKQLLTTARVPRCIGGAQVNLMAMHIGGMDALTQSFTDYGFAGPTRLIVGRIDRPLSSAQLDLPCVELIRSRPDLAVCLDSLVSAQPDDCADLAAVDPGLNTHAFTQLVTLPPPNDYQAVCSRDDGSTGTVPKCLGRAAKVQFSVDPVTGLVEIPVRWNMILRSKGNPGDFFGRAVEGSTALMAFTEVDRQIVFPGAAFLETVPPNGGVFKPAPIFLPSTERPNELTLLGTADKGYSVLRLFPRRLWKHGCDGGPNQGQACEPTPVDNPQMEDCPQAACGDQLPARYYACVGGTSPGMPCTRSHQCGTGGKCSSPAACQTKLGGGSHKDCQTDGDCTVPGEQCGRALFDLRDRFPNGIGTLERTADFGDRGVCASGNDEGDLCHGPLSCSLGFVSCVQYRAAANAEITPAP